MLSEIIRRIERPAAILLLSWAVLLNLRFFVSAGPLWRDEANSVQQACLPGWDALLGSLQHDSFPVLYPAILKGWMSIPSLGGDLALRVMGLLVGLGLLLSVCLVCRLFGSRVPIVALVLLGVDPVLISEACSVRPYGLTLLTLLWAFASVGMCLTRPSPRWFLVASIASILSVQLSYSSAFFIAAFCLAAAVLALWRGERRLAVSLLLPGLLSALTLLPYWPVLARIRQWAVLLHYRADWAEFFASYAKEHGLVSPAAWIVFLALACLSLMFHRRSIWIFVSGPEIVSYAIGVAAVGLLAQVVFVEFMKVPPFPRYFLPALMFVGITLQLALERRPRTSHIVLAAVALFLTAGPSWSWLGLQRTNMDRVASVLAREARAKDLVIISPWFLHPSFQRYYAGPADWITVPVMPASPITRYDLFMSAMFRSDTVGELSSRIASTLSRGGRLWLVYQAIGQVPDPNHPPETPHLPSTLSGEDYVRYRSYWEREIFFQLKSGCHPEELPVSASRRVWDEERLLLALWTPVGGAAESRLKIQTK
jgi:hypothetical protein